MGRRSLPFALAAALALAPAARGSANIDVHVNIGLPGLVVAERPEVILVPGTRVYFPPAVSAEIVFFDGFWWLRDGGRWHRSHHHRGPWAVVAPQYVPVPVLRLPRDYRRTHSHRERIPYERFERECRHREPERERERERGEYGHREGKGEKHGKGHHRGKGHERD